MALFCYGRTIMRSPACQYSFDDLFSARFGRLMTEAEKQELYALSQEKRNEKVGEWAQKIGWQTDDIIGDDGVTYRSFMPKLEL